MSVDRDPQVGDVFRHEDGSTTYEVVAATERNVFYESTELRIGCFNDVGRWRDEAILIPPRPKVKDGWGLLWKGEFVRNAGAVESDSRWTVRQPYGYQLARIINGRVCDEHGVPFEVES